MTRPSLIRRLLRGAARLAAALAVLAVALAAAVQLRWQRTFDAPLPALHASTDSAIIARGRYLAFGPARCVSCHVAPADRARLAAGEEPPLAGGVPFALPVGRWYTANLTPDSVTGIGAWSDAQLARVLRYGVRHDGRTLLPAMEYQGLADEDVVALMSYLRSRAAVRHVVPERAPNFLGRALLAFVVKPHGPSQPPPAAAPHGATADAGAYLADEVAGCDGCHTKRSPLTGRYAGTPYAGGAVFRRKGTVLVSPNLTPSPDSGRITSWSEAQFVARFRAGRAHPASPMEWEAFQRMRDEELRAIHRYLRSLPVGR